MEQCNDEARMTNERINAEVRMSVYAVSASSFGFVSDFDIRISSFRPGSTKNKKEPQLISSL